MHRPCLSVLALLFAASIVLAEDPAAQELYKKVSDAFMAAKTVHLKEAKTSATDKSGQSFGMDSDIWLAADNQLCLDMEVKFGGQGQKMKAVCDGKTLALSGGPGEKDQKEAAAELSNTIRGAIMAGGVMPAMSIMDHPEGFKNGGTSDFQALVEGKVGDRTATVIEYTFHFTSGSEEVDLGVKLYVDKDTLAILKREASQPKEQLQITEEYGVVELDATAPDGTFTVPEASGPDPEPEPEPPAEPK